MEPRNTSNIGHVDHARKTKIKRQPYYPTINLNQDNVRNQFFYTISGRATSHSDIGTGEMSLNWMIKQAKKEGMRFSNEENDNSQ